MSVIHTLNGVIMGIRFQDMKTGNGIFSMKTKEDDLVLVKGPLPLSMKYAPLSLTGQWEMDSQYGKQFVFKEARFYAENLSDIRNFLDEFGKTKAHKTLLGKILKETSLHFFDVMEDTDYFSDALQNSRPFLRLIGKIITLKKTMQWQAVYKDFPLLFFEKLIKKYSLKNAEESFDKNIYQIGMDLGLTFKQCDFIAKMKAKNYYDTDRIIGGYRYVMSLVLSNGNTYAELDRFLLLLQKLLGSPKISVTYLYTLKPDWMIVDFNREKPIIYDNKYYKAEKSIAKNITRLSLAPDEDFKESYFETAQKECGIHCGTEQREAICAMSRKRGVKILTGNPGTGKTTSINVFIHVYKTMHPSDSIVLCAPTGRAAQRMQESTDYPASTIHHLLQYYSAHNQKTCKNEYDPITADLLIVDEMSMVDVELFDLLLKAVQNNTCIVLVGDPNQLQSVGPGNVLSDLIDSGLIDHYHLTEVFRQKHESLILTNAFRINNGIDALQIGDDFKVYLAETEQQMTDFAEKICRANQDVQIMSPVKGGEAGVHEMNRRLQGVLNANAQKFVQYGDTRFYLGDKVIMTSNCPTMNFYNGDLGTIIDISSEILTIQFPTKQIQIGSEYFSEMDLAYSITIHKSQGSEFPLVLIILPFNGRSKNLLRRNLLYTAVTRCKQKTIILAQKEKEDNALSYCIRNVSKKRNGRLLECLTQTKEVVA